MRTTPSPLTRLVSTEASSGIQSIRKTFFGSNALKLIDPPDLTKDVDDYGSPKAPTLGLNTTTISPFSVSALPEKLQFSPAAMYRIIDPRGLTQVPESLLLVEGFSRYVLMKQRFFNLTKNIHFRQRTKPDVQDQILSGSEPEFVAKKKSTTRPSLEILKKFPTKDLEDKKSRNTIEFFHMPDDRVFGFSSLHYDSNPAKFSYEAKTSDEKNIRMRLIQDSEDDPNLQVFVENFANPEEDTTQTEETDLVQEVTTMTSNENEQ